MFVCILLNGMSTNTKRTWFVNRIIKNMVEFLLQNNMIYINIMQLITLYNAKSV